MAGYSWKCCGFERIKMKHRTMIEQGGSTLREILFLLLFWSAFCLCCCVCKTLSSLPIHDRNILHQIFFFWFFQSLFIPCSVALVPISRSNTFILLAFSLKLHVCPSLSSHKVYCRCTTYIMDWPLRPCTRHDFSFLKLTIGTHNT